MNKQILMVMERDETRILLKGRSAASFFVQELALDAHVRGNH